MNNIRVKICGLTNLEDARVAVEAGADLLGFIFYPKSPRYVAPETVAEIIQKLKESTFKTIGSDQHSSFLTPHSSLPRFVGVFVNESIERIATVLAQTGLDYAQLHGNETPELLAQLQGRGYKALRPTSADEAYKDAARFAARGSGAGPGLMLDAYDPNLYGGTGKTADWRMAAELAQQYPGLLLAGSLTPKNVAEAIRIARPWGVDVSSGVEATPGRKDHVKVQEFIRKANRAAWKIDVKLSLLPASCKQKG
jgi:phosphoribosylanthranilate isomerase